MNQQAILNLRQQEKFQLKTVLIIMAESRALVFANLGEKSP